jgi:hypothetical protein
MGVKEPAVAGLVGRIADVDRRQHVVGPQLTGEQLVNLPHRHAAIVFDDEYFAAGSLGADRRIASLTQVSPDGVLDVVAVDGLIAFELLRALGISTGIVQRDTPLPMPRPAARVERDLGVERGHAVGELRGAKGVAAAGLELFRRRRRLRHGEACN